MHHSFRRVGNIMLALAVVLSGVSFRPQKADALILPSHFNFVYRGVTFINETFTDYTSKASDAAIADVPVGAINSILTSSALYLGAQVPFDSVDFSGVNYGLGGTLNYKYSTAGNTFTALSNVVDQNTFFTTGDPSALAALDFPAPTDWVKTDVNGQNAYWLVLESGVDYTSAPDIGEAVYTAAVQAVDPALSTVQVLGSATRLADGNDAAVVDVTVVDAWGNPMQDAVVTLVSDLGVTIAPQSVTTDSAGDAIFNVTSLNAGLATFTATAEGVVLPATATATFVVVPTKSESVVAVSSFSLPADGNTQTIVSVDVNDINGSPIPFQTVTLTPVSIPPAGLVFPITADSGAGGVAQFIITSTDVVSMDFNVSVGGIDFGNTGVIDFTAPVADASASTATVSPSAVFADGVTPAVVSVHLVDVHGYPIQGQLVDLRTTVNGVPYVPLNVSGTTDAQGDVALNVVASVASVITVDVIANDTVELMNHPVITFIAVPDASKSDIGVSPNTLPADGNSQSIVSVSVIDTNTLPIAGQTVTLAPVSNPPAGLVFPATATTDAFGTATFAISSSVVTSMDFTVTAGAVLLGTTPTIDFTAPIADANSSVSVFAPSVPADGTTDAVTVTLVDANNIAIPNQLVTVNYDLNGSQFSNWGITDSAGVVTINVFSTMVGTVALDVVANGIVLSTHPSVDFTVPPPVDFAHSTITASPLIIPADGVSTSLITVTIVDTAGNPMAGQVIGGIWLLNGNTQGGFAMPVTNAQGVSTVQVSQSNPIVQTYGASVNGMPIAQTVDVTFVGVTDAAKSTVGASQQTIVADGIAQSTITVHAQNIYQNNIVGQSVSLVAAAAPAGLVVTAVNGGVTDASGNTTFMVSSPNGGVATFTATVDNSFTKVQINQTATVTFVGLLPPATIDVSNSKVDPQPNTLPADGITQSLVTVTLTDANTNMPAVGQLVNLADINSLGGVVITANNAGVTDNNGQVTFVVTGTTVGQAALSATVNGTSLNKVALDFTVVPPDPAMSKFSVYPTSLLPNGGNPVVVTVVLIDQFGNIVPNYPVDLNLTSVPVGMNVVVAPGMTVTSDAQGMATFSLTADVPGSFGVGASANGISLAPSVQITVHAMNQGNSNITVSPLTQPADGSSIVLMTVNARDAQGAPIIGQQVILSGGGQGVTVSGSGVTDQNGDAIYKVTSTNAGTVVFGAKMGNNLFSQTATMTFTSTGQSGQIGGGSSGGGGGGGSVIPTPAAPVPQVLGAHTGDLVKIASNSAVYFVATDGKRHAFPNEKVYFTWYQNFDDVVTISDAEMAALPLGTNVTYRPGTRMVKFQSLAKVYVVSKAGELRWVNSESLAASLYGQAWATMVDDVSDAFFVNYHFGADVTEVTGFNPATETAAVPTIEQNM